jgi:hypothetical protein
LKNPKTRNIQEGSVSVVEEITERMLHYQSSHPVRIGHPAATRVVVFQDNQLARRLNCWSITSISSLISFVPFWSWLRGGREFSGS